MAPPLQGHTLGQRQKFYNELVDIAIEEKISNIPKIDFDDDDIDNMIRIDIACREKNAEYILDVFKCEDMMYVSRAINKSTWLVTERQYAHIINPKYLHSELFPQMNAKAVTKLMLHIRRHLKDDVRVKAFYEYVYKKKPKAALQWLGNCPLKFVEQIITARANEIPLKLFRRFCKKSLKILRLFIKHQDTYDASEIMKGTKHFLKNKETAEEFLDIVEYCQRHHFQFTLNEKCTKILMKTCPEKIKQAFLTFYNHIDLPTFVKYIRNDEIKSFLFKLTSTTSGSPLSWKSFETLAPFMGKLPREDILDFLSVLYEVDFEYDGSKDSIKEKDKSNVEAFFYAIDNYRDMSFKYIYRWYRFAPFDIAFRDLRKFILAESDPEERHAMLIVLLSCASDDCEHLKTVLQYYHDKHINEPYLHKKTFIDSVLSQHRTYRFDNSMWKILNALFHSSEVYIESTNDVQEALISVIVRNVISDQPVHEVVEEKFKIETLKQIRTKLSLDEQDKVFNYLHNLMVKRFNLQSTGSETGMRKAIELLKTIWNLIKDWDRVASHHRFVIDKIAKLCDINEESSWAQEMKKSRRKRRNMRPNRDRKLRRCHFRRPNPKPYIDIPSIYKMVNSYRHLLFEQSLRLHASEEAMLNVLKHDPQLLARYKTDIDFLRTNDEISLNTFLSKLRIYWPDSLATEWRKTNTEYLKKLSGHRALVRGIITLLPRNKALEFIKMYTPDENKIQWSEANEIELSVQKHIAKNMHIARPQLPAEVVLWYAKGDYLQYALLSLSSMYYNQRPSDVRKYIALMLNAPVSLQKHGVRLAFARYNTDEKIEMAPKLWKKTRNASIRAVLFTSIYDLLTKEKNLVAIKAIWLVLSSFIDDLNDEENKIIYRTLGKVRGVPLSVVGDFYQKAYLFLKSLPAKVGMDHVLEIMVHCDTETLIEHLDSEFVEKTLLGSTSDIMVNHESIKCCYGVSLEIMVAYLLCSKDLNIQMQKYNNLMQPVIDKCVTEWINGETRSLGGIEAFLGHICRRIPRFAFEKKMQMPVEILRNISDSLLKGSLHAKEHYIQIRRWQLAVRYIETLDEMKKSNEQYNWGSIRTASAPQIASICHYFISEDQRTFFPSIYSLFKETLETFFKDFQMPNIDILTVLYELLSWEDCSSMYLLVLEMIPHVWGEDQLCWEKKIKQKIYSHPSEEITMHYFKRYSDHYSTDEDDSEYSDDSDTDTSSEEQSEDGDDEHHSYKSTKYRSLFGYSCSII